MKKSHYCGVNFFDRLNASVLSLVTSEMPPLLKRTRKRNNYPPDFPTFDQPAPMPFKNVNIDGVHIRYAHSHAEGKPTLVMLCPFPQSIMAYAPHLGRFGKSLQPLCL